jgi:hypothetical protein
MTAELTLETNKYMYRPYIHYVYVYIYIYIYISIYIYTFV